MERSKKHINVVWCDDNIDSLVNETKRELFALHDCYIFKTAKTSNKLKEILSTYKNYIDAVIVDFNMSDSKQIPGEQEASGFRWIHDNIDQYSSIPFYLFSGRDLSFIEEKYHQYEIPTDNDYFLSKNPYVSSGRNRHFQADETTELLEMIVEEVEVRRSPTYRIRQEYSEAFAAIDKFGLDGDVFINILLSDNSIKNGSEIIYKANPLRMQIEKLVSILADTGIIPQNYIFNLNDVPSLLHLGKEKKGTPICSPEHRMMKSLREAFVFFLNYTQDGSHNNDYLRIDFKNYLERKKDVYIIKALAIIGLDIIQWAGEFYNHYQPLQRFRIEPFTAKVQELKTVTWGEEGAIVYDSKGNKYFVVQPNNPKYRYEIGSYVKIISRPIPTSEEYGDYYCSGINLDVK